MSGLQLSLTPAEAGAELELVDGELVAERRGGRVGQLPSPPPRRPPLRRSRSATCSARRSGSPPGRRRASTRRQYGAIFRAFGDWLAGELGRPPVVGDLDADVIAAYGRHLATSGGRGGGRRRRRPCACICR